MTLFRWIAFLEGISYILLLFVAVPIKYILGIEIYVKILGLPHGLLFSTYIIFVFYYNLKKFWGISAFLLMILASILPFGTFYIDQKYLKNYAQ
tara:strand:- start:72 stop:353 length:282 start_codon:yes stop_codon:yes gene_type:complete